MATRLRCATARQATAHCVTAIMPPEGAKMLEWAVIDLGSSEWALRIGASRQVKVQERTPQQSVRTAICAATR